MTEVLSLLQAAAKYQALGREMNQLGSCHRERACQMISAGRSHAICRLGSEAILIMLPLNQLVFMPTQWASRTGNKTVPELTIIKTALFGSI
jgi:hypothetical protein